MRRIAFHVNAEKPAAAAVRERLAAVAAACGLAVAEPSDAVDAVVVLGGDGTMLSAVHAFPGVPLLGLNLGSLGFLAGVEEPDFEAAVRALAEGNFTLSERTVLRAAGCDALNDIVVSKGVSGHIARVLLKVDGRPVTRFACDGLVVATPTGSTAYSLAAGGSVMLPDCGCLAVTPICPHALSSRPLVLRDTARMALAAETRDGALAVYADGRRVAELAPGAELEIVRSPRRVPLVMLKGYNPYEVLGRKLGWSGEAVRSA